MLKKVLGEKTSQLDDCTNLKGIEKKGNFNFNQKNTEETGKWFKLKTDQYDYDILANEVFNNSKDQILKNLLKQKKWILDQRINNLENYLQALQNVVLLISTEYKKLD